ncbi:VOC family protein [Yinghuangia sp. YIM S09857]|uniref:VOC family protein n=1 Tax=Yinghuangia sp. YIM S09857 TaxID=3436929 RepID=UPI003F52C1E9
MPTPNVGTETSHFGICVTDLDKSLHFYCTGLGFEPFATYPIGSEYGKGLEVPGTIDLTAQFIRKGGMVIELLHFRSPEVEGTPSNRRNRVGLTHIAFVAEDVNATVAHLVACGGTVLEHTRTVVDMPDGRRNELVFLEDPDGVRVEIGNSHAG